MGIDYGIIIVVFGGILYEIIIFCKDVVMDGCCVIVVFFKSVMDDVWCWDFMMNVFYVDWYGEVLDFFGGMVDFEVCVLWFIDDLIQCICEDYLWILRFFCFYLWYGDLVVGMDLEVLVVIVEIFEGFEQILKECVGVEILKLLFVIDLVILVVVMWQIGVLG